MPRGEKTKYTGKQKRQAEHIEEGYEKRGVPASEAKRRAWATVNQMTGGGKKAGSGRGKPTNTRAAHKGGKRWAAPQPLRVPPRKNRPPPRRPPEPGPEGNMLPQAGKMWGDCT